MEKNPWLRALIILGVVLISVQLFGVVWSFGRHYGDIILVFFLAWMIAFLLNPVVEFLTIGERTPRVLAVTWVYLGLLAILVAIGFLLLPPAANQLSALGKEVPQYTNNTSRLVTDLQSWLSSRGINIDLQQYAVGRDLSKDSQQLGAALASHALTVAQSVIVAVFDGAIVLVISFYMMIDGPRITRAVKQVTPERYRGDLELLLASIDRSFGGYLRSSVVLAVVYAIGTGAAMYALGVPYALPISVFAGVMLIIPFVGDIVAVIPPIVIALLTVSLVRTLVLVAIMIGLQQLVLQVLRPKVMGRSVGLHPLWVLAAFLVGARAAGVWGAIFSVPIAAIGQTIVQLYYYRIAGKTGRESALAHALLGTHHGGPGPPQSQTAAAAPASPSPDALTPNESVSPESATAGEERSKQPVH